MKLIRIEQKNEWEAFQAHQPYSQFLQSWIWGEFSASLGKPVMRLALVEDEGSWLIAIQMEYRLRKFGTGYWFAPRGPVFSSLLSLEEKRKALFALTEELLKIKDLRKKTLFWRFEPVSELGNPEGLVPLSFRRNSAQNPTSTLLLKLAPSLPEIQKQMHEKTRYNIRVAERHGVSVRLAHTEKDVETFLDLMDQTAARDNFIQHPRSYIKKMYEYLKTNNMSRIRLAELEGRVLSANLEIAYGDTVTYLYGTSSSEYRNVMAPYALHWNAIQEAKALGYQNYDFWGLNPWSKAMYYYKPSWEGITRFKLGWGGERVDLVGTWDLPFNSLVYRLLFIDKFFRG
ncbi:MAG: peptidoglycan bridge formation glycyltransferase FemA/FemB family protein [Patescibacteria group bacterium]